MDTKAVHEALTSGKIALIDVRDPEAFAEEHADGAINIPLQYLNDELENLEKDVHFVTSCGGGSRGPKAAELLKEHGFNAEVMPGGLRDWKAENLPTKTRG